MTAKAMKTFNGLYVQKAILAYLLKKEIPPSGLSPQKKRLRV